MVTASFDAKSGTMDLDKPISSILVDAFSLEKAKTETSNEGAVTVIELSPRGRVKIERTGTSFSLSAENCLITTSDATDGQSYVQTIRPGKESN